MTKNINASFFNFSDTAGVPEEVAKAVNSERRGGLNEDLYEAIVAVVNSAPKPIGIKQVIFVLHKLVTAGELEKVPGEPTVRAYLNKARENEDIGKPTRQSYSTPETDVPDAEQGDEAAGEAGEAPEGDEDLGDDLADL